MTYYVLVETATGNFETYANRRTIELFTEKEDAENKLKVLKDYFMQEQYKRDYAYDFILSTNYKYSVIRPCEDYIYNDTSEYSLEIREIEL